MFIRRIAAGVRALFIRHAIDRQLDEELRAYLESAIEDRMRTGMTRAQAERAARAEIGSLEAVKDYTRDAGWESIAGTVWQDIRYALRSFRRSPGFTAAAMITLGLGIGGTTAIFSVVDGLFLRPPAGIADASPLRRVYMKRDSGSITTGAGGPGSWVDYATLRDRVPAFARVAAIRGTPLADLGRGAEAEQIRAGEVSYEFLDLLGLQPAQGRFFRPEEDGAQGAFPVAVISYGMWQTRFGGARDAVGRTILLNGDLLEIVGVTPRQFVGIGADPVDVWVPSSVPRENRIDGQDWRTWAGTAGYYYVARLAPGATETMAAEQAASALHGAATATPSMDQTPEIAMTSLALSARPYKTKTGDLSLWLVVVAGFVLIISCSNVASLLLARGLTRRRELAIRLSIGAGRWRVVRQHLTESIVLASLGGAVGVIVAYWGLGLVRQFPIPPSAGILDARLLAFTIGLSVVTGLIFGIIPAIRAPQADPVRDLKDARGAAPPSRQRTRRALVALQVALSLVLLVGAALFVRSLWQATSIDAGAELDRRFVARVDLSRSTTPIDRIQFYERAQSRLRALPGVENVGLVHFEPLSGSMTFTRWQIAGRPGVKGSDVQLAQLNAAGPGYFAAAGTRLLRGREMAEADLRGDPVAVVNEGLARVMADEGNIVGACVPFGNQVKAGGCTRIIGVVENQRHRYLEPDEPEMVFLSWTNAPDVIDFGVPALVIQTRSAGAGQISAIRSALQGLRSDLPYVAVTPLAENVRDDLLPFRLGAILFSMFALLAVIVAGVGVYGVLGYFVSERTPEIGIRRSLGAPRFDVASLVVAQSLLPVALGLLAGLGVAYGGTRYLGSLLFGVEPRDAVSFAVAAAFLLGVAIVATLFPAWRAVRVDPMVALRSE